MRATRWNAKSQHVGVWKWGVGGALLWGIGSVMVLRGSWYSAETVTENATFVVANAFIGAVLGLLAGWFGAPKQGDPRRAGWLW